MSMTLLRTLVDWQRQGQRAALLTLIRIDGHAPYPVGAQMIVNERGDYFGYVTGGCVEPALVEHAISAMKSQKTVVERYGRHSPYFDIVLPCGSGVDILISPSVRIADLDFVISALMERRAVDMKTDIMSGVVSLSEAPQAETQERMHYLHASEQNAFFYRYYSPAPKIVLIGQGPILISLARLAVNVEMEVQILCNDNNTLHSLKKETFSYAPLSDLDEAFLRSLDRYTAIVSLFHDHDVEIDLLSRVVNSQAGFIGALGSRLTHNRRVQELQDRGVSQKNINKIHGPVGLNIGAKTPRYIAVSILADVIATLPKVT